MSEAGLVGKGVFDSLRAIRYSAEKGVALL